MTTFGMIITLLGAASVASGLVHLFDLLDRPHSRRRAV